MQNNNESKGKENSSGTALIEHPSKVSEVYEELTDRELEKVMGGKNGPGYTGDIKQEVIITSNPELDIEYL